MVRAAQPNGAPDDGVEHRLEICWRAADDPKDFARRGLLVERSYYDYYHQSIRRFVDEVRHKYPAGLLIDVHGQDKGPDVVMRGTLNGRGVERLLRRAGVDAVTGPHGVFGQLETNGFRVFPGNDVPPEGHSEDAGYNGGYTVFTYGSHNRSGIDALQMEFGTRYRQKDVLEKSARAAANAIAGFYETYLRQPTIR